MTTNASLIDDCFLHDKDRLRHDDALDLLRANLSAVAGMEEAPLARCVGRIVAQDILAPHPVPLHTNAAVDGYAFCHSDLNAAPFEISDRIAAGDLAPAPLKQATAVRIFTGAPMPDGADSVAMQEDCTATDTHVTLPIALKTGANCRKAGEDLTAGEIVVSAGTRLSATTIAAAASIGLATVGVYSKLTISLFSSGNEMRRVEDDNHILQPGEVWDANAPMLAALLEPLPVEIIDHGVLADDAEIVATEIEKASLTSDIIITTGGASRGSEDYMLSTLDKLGRRHLWQLAVKPGRPMMFGQIKRPENVNDCIFLGLPGNPVAALVCFLLYTRPTILALAGATWDIPIRYSIPAAFEMANKKPDRREFLRGILQHDQQGKLHVTKFARDGSGLISSLRMADGLVEIREDITRVKTGDAVQFIPFSQFR